MPWLLVCALGVDLPMHAVHGRVGEPRAVAPGEQMASGPALRSSLYSESYYSTELECPAGCFAQPMRDDHAGIMKHHIGKAERIEEMAESSDNAENKTENYAALYREIETIYYELSRWDHVIRAVMAAQSTVVHGDPMFKVNGTGTHFWLMEGQLTPLLTWGGDGDPEKMLLGRTFAHPDAGINAQWFGEFAIMSKDQTVIEITAAERRTMNITFDGKQVRAGKSTVKAEYNSPTGVRLELTATENGEQATVEAGDMRVRIFSSGAAKFSRKAEQNKYSHLNLNFEFLPTKGRGIFAELAGLRPMSAATQALLKSPSESRREIRSEDQGSVSAGIRKMKEATSLVGTYANQLRPFRELANHSAADAREATTLFGSVKGARRRKGGAVECVCPPPVSPPGDEWYPEFNVPPQMPPSAPAPFAPVAAEEGGASGGASLLARLGQMFGGSASEPEQDDRVGAEPESGSPREPGSEPASTNTGVLHIETPDLAAKSRRVSN